MMEPMASIRRERGEARRAAQAIRDVAVVLFLALLAFSVRFDAADPDPAVKPHLGGVQAAGLDQAAPPEPQLEPAPEPAVMPALAHPVPAGEAVAPPVALQRDGLRVVIHGFEDGFGGVDGEVHVIRFPARLPAGDDPGDCPKQQVAAHARS